VDFAGLKQKLLASIVAISAGLSPRWDTDHRGGDQSH
jgi:hypothetical protein